MTYFLHETHYRDMTPAADRLITICGTGALGANLAETLARMGLRRLRVIDRDRVEAHNLSTQPWVQHDVGGPKARILANALYRAVGTRVEAQVTTLAGNNARALLKGSTVVVDAFDNLASRAAVGDAARASDTPCLHIALGGTGDYGCGLWDDAYTIPIDKRPMPDTCDYPLTRPLALLVAAAAAEVLIGYLLTGSRRNFESTLRDMHLMAMEAGI